jgi:glycosyltransferase involved in cell wall biosynthesis
VVDAEPLITVIIPTFRRPKSLRRAILSVLNQTFPAFQVCVYDDASGDDTQKVVVELAKTDSRIKYWCHEQNIGFMANFNYGLKEVNTPFFSFLNDDDLLLPHFFEQAVQSLVSNPDVMFYSGSTILVKDNKVVDVRTKEGRLGYFAPPDGALEILSGQRLWTSVIFRSEVVDHVGVLDIEAGMALDFDFQLRIAAHHPIITSNQPSAIFSLDEGSISDTTSDFKLIWPAYRHIGYKMMSDESLPLGVRIMIQGTFDKWLYYQLRLVAGRAIDRGESDTVYAVADVMKRVCNKNTRPTLLLFSSKVRELSKPAYFVVNLIKRLFIFCASFFMVLANNKKSRQLQKKYGKYLHYLNDYTR